MPELIGRPNGSQVTETRRVKEWVRDELGLGDDVAILVTELACTEPGCPPLETVIALMGPDSEPRKLTVHRPLGDITESELRSLLHVGAKP